MFTYRASTAAVTTNSKRNYCVCCKQKKCVDAFFNSYSIEFAKKLANQIAGANRASFDEMCARDTIKNDLKFTVGSWRLAAGALWAFDDIMISAQAEDSPLMF